MNDYRIVGDRATRTYLAELEANGLPRSKNGLVDLWRGHVRSGLPPDRKGLIQATHDVCMFDELDNGGGVMRWNETAKRVAIQTNQRVYTGARAAGGTCSCSPSRSRRPRTTDGTWKFDGAS